MRVLLTWLFVLQPDAAAAAILLLLFRWLSSAASDAVNSADLTVRDARNAFWSHCTLSTCIKEIINNKITNSGLILKLTYLAISFLMVWKLVRQRFRCQEINSQYPMLFFGALGATLSIFPGQWRGECGWRQVPIPNFISAFYIGSPPTSNISAHPHRKYWEFDISSPT